MALDEAISEAVRQKLSPPTIRTYQWDLPSVTIGFFQKISDINIDHCGRKSYPIIRRITGGRAILHDSELTYSVSSLTDSFPFRSRLHENYAIISKALIRGLTILGIDASMSFSRKRAQGPRYTACFKTRSYGEVTVKGKKVIGSAQKRYHDSFLQQGSILMDFNARELSNVLNDHAESDFRDIGSIGNHDNKISFSDISISIKEAFERELHVKLVSDGPSEFELGLAKELEIKKYTSQEWNLAR